MTEDADRPCSKCGGTDQEVVLTKTVQLTLVTSAERPEYDRFEYRCRQCGQIDVLFKLKKT
jgi:uncharacterized Zn finger protein